MSFGEKLKSIRKEKGYSQETLAEKLDVSRQTITKWETGVAFPEMSKVLSLARELNASLDFLFSEELNEEERRRDSILEEEMALKKMNKDLLQDALKYNSKKKDFVIKTGIESFDEINGGLKRGICFLFGANHIGKMDFALNVTNYLIKNNKGVMIVLKKSFTNRVLHKLICIEANVKFSGSREYTKEEEQRLRDSSEVIERGNLLIDDSYADTVEKLLEKCINNKEFIDLLIIDSLSLLQTCRTDISDDEKRKYVKYILRKIVRECKCAILCLDNINQNVETSLVVHSDPSLIMCQVIGEQKLEHFDDILIMHRDDYYQVDDKDYTIIDFIFNSTRDYTEQSTFKCMRKKGYLKLLEYDETLK